MNSTSFLYHFLKIIAFFIKIISIPIKNMGIFRLNIDILEEIFPHIGMVAFRVISWKANIFIHVKSFDISKRKLPRFAEFHQLPVHSKR